MHFRVILIENVSLSLQLEIYLSGNFIYDKTWEGFSCARGYLPFLSKVFPPCWYLNSIVFLKLQQIEKDLK